MKIFLKDAFGWGFLLWLFGYAFGIALFPFVSTALLGWVITPFGFALTLYVLFRKVRGKTFSYFFGLATVWVLIAMVGDYVFIVKMLAPADGYYKFDVYLYYLLTSIMPLLVWWMRENRFVKKA